MATSRVRPDQPSLTGVDSLTKRAFDVVLSFTGLFFLWWLIVLAYIAASIDTKANGFFLQERIGQGGRMFRVVKIRTMRVSKTVLTTITQSGDPRITSLGRLFRKTKIDELPQLWNVLVGEMSLVGPRPDVPGYADLLTGAERAVLSIKPGITGPASLKYRDEEAVLAAQEDPERYNREVIYPDKVQINLEYIRNWSFSGDLQYIFKTIFG